jgi:signal transduction histidine kinase
VELIAHRAGDTVEIHVRDQGAGFSDTYLAHPFERFAPTASTGRGTGLGLAIVQAITEAHGGVVRLTNDAGASVTLWLPTDPTRPVAAPGIDQSSPATATDREQQWSPH